VALALSHRYCRTVRQLYVLDSQTLQPMRAQWRRDLLMDTVLLPVELFMGFCGARSLTDQLFGTQLVRPLPGTEERVRERYPVRGHLLLTRAVVAGLVIWMALQLSALTNVRLFSYNLIENGEFDEELQFGWVPISLGDGGLRVNEHISIVHDHSNRVLALSQSVQGPPFAGDHCAVGQEIASVMIPDTMYEFALDYRQAAPQYIQFCLSDPTLAVEKDCQTLMIEADHDEDAASIDESTLTPQQRLQRQQQRQQQQRTQQQQQRSRIRRLISDDQWHTFRTRFRMSKEMLHRFTHLWIGLDFNAGVGTTYIDNVSLKQL
jgi:hypothetical protein